MVPPHALGEQFVSSIAWEKVLPRKGYLKLLLYFEWRQRHSSRLRQSIEKTMPMSRSRHWGMLRRMTLMMLVEMTLGIDS